jgi:hypothetical protein
MAHCPGPYSAVLFAVQVQNRYVLITTKIKMMLTVMLTLAGLICFRLFFKSIEVFEKM